MCVCVVFVGVSCVSAGLFVFAPSWLIHLCVCVCVRYWKRSEWTDLYFCGYSRVLSMYPTCGVHVSIRCANRFGRVSSFVLDGKKELDVHV